MICKTSSKLIIKTLERPHLRHFVVFIANFENISHINLSVSVVNFEQVNTGWVIAKCLLYSKFEFYLIHLFLSHLFKWNYEKFDDCLICEEEKSSADELFLGGLRQISLFQILKVTYIRKWFHFLISRRFCSEFSCKVFFHILISRQWLFVLFHSDISFLGIITTPNKTLTLDEVHLNKKGFDIIWKRRIKSSFTFTNL